MEQENGFMEDDELPIYSMSQDYRHEYSGNRRQKVFNDSVHGHFELHRASVALIDTPEFQRLRNLKQLGLAYKIFPGASHNRFEHSLGVAHLATQWGVNLLNSRDGAGTADGWQLRRLEPEDRQHLAVLQLTGLTHDLGHGPFSHVFEKELLPRLGLGADVVRSWEHETMSQRILDHMLEDPENGIDLEELAHLDAGHVNLIKELMHGSLHPQQKYAEAPWLFDVVANKRNGIDVDKFDYLARDSLMCGVKVPLDATRLMLFSRLSPSRDQVVFKQTEWHNLSTGLFHSRAEMHRRVYTHQKIKSVEFMVCDILALVAEPLGLRDAIGDLQAYINLDDSMLQRVKLLVPEQYENPEAVRKAQALLQQLERRKLYKWVSEITPPTGQRCATDSLGLQSAAEQIVGYQSTADTGVNLRPEDIIVCEITIDQGMKTANPMSSVRFYQTADPEGGAEPFELPQDRVTNMLGTVYQDKIIRVYSKNRDPAVIKALKQAFTKWAEVNYRCQPPGTPWRQPPTYQQQPPRAPASVERLGAGRASGAQGLAQAMFRGGSDNGSNGTSSDGELQHMGSGGRSRKRSLNPDMLAASQGSQEQQQWGAAPAAAAANGSQGSGRPAKAVRVNSSSLPGIAEEDG